MAEHFKQEQNKALADASSQSGVRHSQGLSPAQKRGPIAAFFYNNRTTIVLAVSLLAVLVLLQNIMSGDIQRLDSFAYQLFVVRLRRSWLTPIMQSMSNLATPIVIVVMLGVVSAFAPGFRPGRYAAINLVSITALNYFLKEIVQRPRPEGFRLVAESGYSFPSGHSMVAVAFYGFLVWLILHYEKNTFQRWLFSLFFIFVIIGVCISRVYLGVHYASDVLAGVFVALIWLAVYTRIIKSFARKHRRKQYAKQLRLEKAKREELVAAVEAVTYNENQEH